MRLSEFNFCRCAVECPDEGFWVKIVDVTIDQRDYRIQVLLWKDFTELHIKTQSQNIKTRLAPPSVEQTQESIFYAKFDNITRKPWICGYAPLSGADLCSVLDSISK